MREKIKTFFRKKITIAKWQFNLFGLACFSFGAVWGVYLIIGGVFPKIFAADVPISIIRDTAAEFNQGSFDTMGVSGSGSAAFLQLEGATGPDATKYRRSMSVANTAGQDLSNYLVLIDEGEVGYWNMNETSGATVAESSGNVNNGTAVGTTIIDGKYGKARSFNGTSDYVSIPASTSLNLTASPVTMEAWIKTNSVGATQQIFSKGQTGTNGYGMALNSTGFITIGGFGGSNFNGTTPISAGQWYHVVGVINGASTKIYVNGVADSASGTVNVMPGAFSAQIGAGQNSSSVVSGFFNGQIDEVRVYNRALSLTEVQSLYTNNASPLLNGVYAHTQESGADLRFYDSDNTTELKYWVERYTAAGQNAKVWIKIPSLPIAGKNINLYYGSSGATTKSLGSSPLATGGTMTYYSNNVVHTFTASGNFVVPANSFGSVSTLVVAGGAGGGSAHGAGGGAGGVIVNNSFGVSSQTYAITVGTGGAGGASGAGNRGISGLNSVFGSLTAIGGGGGGSMSSSYGNPGGSGGGTGGNASPANAGGAGTAGQGYAGGAGSGYQAGGGGGAGAVGGSAPNSTTRGNGGIGIQSSISGTATYYGGGGGGGGYVGSGGCTGGTGGTGGGGNGSWSTASVATAGLPGTANTGGGGGGGSGNWAAGGTGGSGIVVISYSYGINSVTAGSEVSLLPSAGNWQSPTNANAIDLVWNGGWGDGTAGSTAFSATISNVAANNTATFAMKSAQTKEALIAAPYITLGTANGGTSFTKTKAQLDALGIGIGANRFVQVKVSFDQTSGITPQLDNFTLSYLSDHTGPEFNASNLEMATSSGGRMLAQNNWTNNFAPYFSWTAGTDSQSGVVGYCVYLGLDGTISGNPQTTKGLLGTSPVVSSSCPFVISGTTIDFADVALRGGTWLTTSNSQYYFKLKAIDLLGNVSATSADFYFRFDNTPPNNVAYLSCAAGNFSNVVDMNFMWPTSGNGVASDDNSGLFGYQYQMNTTSSSWSGNLPETLFGIGYYFPLTDNIYNLTKDRDSGGIVSGNNIVYFRAVDQAGNVSGLNSVRTCNLAYGGAAPAFNDTDVVLVTPSVATENSFALTWPEALPSGSQTVAHYYYMVNTPTPASLNTLKNNPSTYFDNGTSREVSLRSLPNINKGTNNVTVVAVDNAETPNYSPSNSISGNFTLNSTDPDNVINLMASDSSIKSLSQWNVTLTWGAPSYQGAGNLSYLVFRSEDGIGFAKIGETSGLSYVDNTPKSKTYFYKVYAKDGADAKSSGTNSVNIFPTGKWTTSPELELAPSASDVTTKKALISWSTKRMADSKVQIGTSSGTYEKVEPSDASQVTSHSIALSGLEPDTRYFYKAKWTDEDGNTGISQEQTFNTAPPPLVKNVSVNNASISSVMLYFATKGSTKVEIEYGQTTNFGGSKEIATASSESKHVTELTDLLDGTKYYYKINTFDSEGQEYEGTVLDFTTLPRPKISDVRVEPIKDSAQPGINVTWNSNTEISSIVSFFPVNNPADKQTEVQVDLTSGPHETTIMNLRPMTTYQLTVKGVDKAGNEAVSDNYSFTTASDTRPPQISDIVVEGMSQQNQGNGVSQLAVSWNTDEAATSQVEFGEGAGTQYSQKTQEDSNLTSNHLVVLSGLTPSKVYHLRIISADAAGNVSKSIDTVSITPKAVNSAFELVVGNLTEVFGFLKGIGN